MKTEALLKKKYTKKKLKKYNDQFRSIVSQGKNTSTVVFSSDKNYNRRKSKDELRRGMYDE